MKAMILAAGKGTRLRPLTDLVPKPMAPIVGEPLLARTVRWLSTQGVDFAAVNLYHRPEAIPAYFGSAWGGVDLRFVFEEELRGTAGGLKGAREYFRDAPFAVIYGDNLLDIDLAPLTRAHEESGAMATIGLFHHPDPTAAGIVGLTEAGRIERFVEKPPAHEVFSDLANAGIYILSPDVLDLIPNVIPIDFGHDVFPEMLMQGIRMTGVPVTGYIQDTGTPDTYRRANWDVMDGLLRWSSRPTATWIGEGATVHPSVRLVGRNVIGRNVTVGRDVQLTDSILWDDCSVEAGAELNNAIVGSGASVRTGERVAPGSLIASQSTPNQVGSTL